MRTPLPRLIKTLQALAVGAVLGSSGAGINAFAQEMGQDTWTYEGDTEIGTTADSLGAFLSEKADVDSVDTHGNKVLIYFGGHWLFLTPEMSSDTDRIVVDKYYFVTGQWRRRQTDEVESFVNQQNQSTELDPFMIDDDGDVVLRKEYLFTFNELIWFEFKPFLTQIIDSLDALHAEAFSEMPYFNVTSSRRVRAKLEGRFEPDLHLDYNELPPQPFAHKAHIETVTFAPNGQMLASASWDGTVKLWTLGDDDSLQGPSKILDHGFQVNDAAFSPNGQRLASGGDDKQVWLWQWDDSNDQKGKHVCRRPFKHDGRVNAVAFAPDGTLLASGSLDGETKLWQVPDCELSMTLGDKDENWVNALAFSPNGQILASAHKDGQIKLWDAGSGDLLPALSGGGHPNPSAQDRPYVESIAFSPDGALLASASYDHTAILWNIRDRSPWCPPFQHDNRVNTVAFSSDGQVLATGSRDGKIRFWEISTCEPLPASLTLEYSVESLAFSPDDEILVSGEKGKPGEDVDVPIRLWQIRVYTR